MLEVISAALPAAVGIAASPVPVIAAVLMLLSPSARTTSVGSLTGWLAGIAVAVSLMMLLAGVLPDPAPDESHPVRATIQLALGLLLLLLAVKTFRGRGSGGEMPAWMSAVDTMSVGRGVVLGFLLAAVNPKNLSMAVAAGLDIVSLTDGVADRAVAIAVFTVAAGLSVAVPVITNLVAPGATRGPLSLLKDWLVANNAAVMAVLFLLLGTSLVSKGLGGY